jgi:hypothetical protein
MWNISDLAPRRRRRRRIRIRRRRRVECLEHVIRKDHAREF